MASSSSRFVGATLCVVSMCFALSAAADPMVQARELYASGNWDTAKEAYQDAFSNPSTKANAALGLAGIFWEQGSLTEAMKFINIADKAATKGKRVDLLGQIRFTKGHILASQGKFSKAQSELKACQKSKDPNFVILCRISHRFIGQIRGQKVSSNVAYQKDLKKLEATGEPLLVATALAKAAELRDRAGGHQEAIALLNQAQAHYKKADSTPAQARNKLRLAAAYQNAGMWDKSATSLNGVVTTFANMNNRPAMVTAYTLLGHQAEHQGDAKKALGLFGKAKKISKGIGSPQMIAQVDLGLCSLHAKTNHLSKSRSHCGSSFAQFSKIRAWTLAARSKILFGGVAQERKEFAEAQRSYKEALSILENKVSPGLVQKRDIALQYANLCQVELELKANTARKTCNKSRKQFGGVAKDLSVYNAMASSEYATGSLSIGKVAREHFEKSAQLFQKAERLDRAADALLRAGKLQKKPGKAATQFENGIALVKTDQTRVGQTVRLQLRTQLAQSRIDQKAWKESKTAVDALVEDAKNQKATATIAWALSARAKVNLKQGDRDGAIRELTECVKASKKARDKEQQSICKENLKRLKP